MAKASNVTDPVVPGGFVVTPLKKVPESSTNPYVPMTKAFVVWHAGAACAETSWGARIPAASKDKYAQLRLAACMENPPGYLGHVRFDSLFTRYACVEMCFRSI